MGLITSLVGALSGSDDDEEAVREEAVRQERERQQAENERKAQQEALREMRERTVDGDAGRLRMRGEGTGSGEAGQLGAFVDERDAEPEPDVPAYTMSVGEPEVDVTIPEDEIEVTSYSPDTTTSPSGRTVDLGALQREADALDGDEPVPGVVDPSLMSDPGVQIGEISVTPGTPPPTEGAGGLSDPIEAQRAALAQMQGATSPGPAASPANPPPSPAVSGPAGPDLQSQPGVAPPPQQGLPGTRLPAMQEQQDQRMAQLPGGSAPGDEGDDDVTRARRVERTMKVLSALLKIGGAAGGAAAIMRGNPVGAIAGRVIGSGGSGLMDAIGEGRGAQAERDRSFGQRQERAEQQDALNALRLAMQERQQGRNAAIQERRLDQADRGLDIREEGQRSLSELRATRAAHEGELTDEKRAELEARTRRFNELVQSSEQDRNYEADRRDPASELSERARELYRAARGVVPELQLSDEALADLSAAELEPFVGRNGSIPRRLSARIRRGGGGAGGGAALQGLYEQVGNGDARVGRAMFNAMSASARNEAIERHRSGQAALDPTEIFPGVRSQVALPQSEIQKIRATVAELGSYQSTLRQIEETGRRLGGATARFDPEARAEIVPQLTVLRGMVANLGNTGTINEGEVPTINAALPNPSDLEQMTFGQFSNRVNTWRTMLDNKLRASLRARSIPEDGINRVMSIMERGVQPRRGGRGGGQSSGGQRYRVTVNGHTSTLSESGMRRAREMAQERGLDIDVQEVGQ